MGISGIMGISEEYRYNYNYSSLQVSIHNIDMYYMVLNYPRIGYIPSSNQTWQWESPHVEIIFPSECSIALFDYRIAGRQVVIFNIIYNWAAICYDW